MDFEQFGICYREMSEMLYELFLAGDPTSLSLRPIYRGTYFFFIVLHFPFISLHFSSYFYIFPSYFFIFRHISSFFLHIFPSYFVIFPSYFFIFPEALELQPAHPPPYAGSGTWKNSELSSSKEALGLGKIPSSFDPPFLSVLGVISGIVFA